MAEQITQDVVKEAQSAGDALPVDVNASTTNTTAGNGPAPTNPTPLDSEPNNNIPPATTETKEHLVNGDAGENSAAESQQAGAYASGSSDTDISRPGSVDQAQRPGGHLRNNSLKKPTSFKSVSVTKNFLAKSAVSAPAVRSGDKTSTPGQSASSLLPSAKPRLVAKSGSGNVPRSVGQMNGAGSGPDGSKVWNKNQPVPPPPPKQFTDEELKQQYGIHLATRLQADEGSKEAKWADIDDDEDDWAPETVQWMDGTKSTVATVESQPPPAPVEEPKPTAKPQSPAPISKPSTPVPSANTPKTTLTGSTKTILKPGAHAPKPKGQPDKPTLVAKPSTAAPVKSPWAPLPPVEKVSPIAINPPAQPAPPSARYSRDVSGYDNMPPPSLPAKEIAPDDFNRSWRDERGNRELFNSHSGRYEPVRDIRRGSIRDSNVRQQPSVLQRPSFDGPAEPSAAFQTSRTSADGPSWGRRRNSSNVSGGSGRVSFDARGADHPSVPMNTARRESQSGYAGDGGVPGTQRHALPPRPLSNDQQPSALAPRPSPSMSQAQPASPLGSITSQDATTPSGGPPPMQNLVEVQQRVMQEKIDSIKLRKQKEMEREAKEEAERKERLRKKMEALGFTDEPKKDQEASPSRPPQKSPLKEKAAPAPVQSPPKPPVPSSEGEVAQYGMIKVHQPQPVKKPSDTLASKPRSARVGPSSADKAQPELDPKLSSSLAPSSGAPSLTQTKPHLQNQTQPHPQPQPLQSGQINTKPSQPAQSSATWSSASLPQQSRPWTSSLWGPPQAKDRALGNGTFGQQVVPQPQASQAPIGVNSALKSATPHQPTAPTQPFVPQPIYSQGATAPKQTTMAPKPRPIAPGWGDFQAQIRRDDQAQIAKAHQDFERMGGDSFIPEIRETFKDNKGRAQNTMHGQIGGLDVKPPQTGGALDLKPKDDVPRVPLEGSTPAHITNQGPHTHTAAQGPRSSRFFPRSSEPVAPVISTTMGDSPPPPETQTHPAHSGDSTSPIVNLPRPAPRVRLPPPVVEPAAQPDAVVSMPPRTRLGPGIGSRPLVLSEEWQTRFNNLLAPSSAAVPPSGAQPHTSTEAAGQNAGSLAVAASSKAPLDVRQTSTPATVSLPNTVSRKIFVDDGSSEVTSRVSADMLLEDREFGSLPTVILPKIPHLAANEPPAGFPSVGRQNSRQGSRYGRGLDGEMFSKPSYNGEFDKYSETIEVRVKFGSIQEAVVKSMPRRRKNGKGPAQQKNRRSFQGGSSPSTGGPNQRPRKPSNYQSQGSNSNSSPRTSSGGAWSNNRSTPPHNNQPWGRRTAPTAPVH
ncbi:hypothetical protein DM02DRAFT_131437 [Periconia macrospinosa]|uniref:PI-PLC Y-box domain-containing protein n=1 Tax=Periconia macrospinosa TaxID=97972 RepID=A0A2V1DDA5_9PLEO|nr:hypothetical protein DM02DRAFT_131437 [Periconia macrospinosa]